MSDIKLFRLNGGSASEIKGSASDLEKPLQSLIENNLQAFLGIRLLASEYSTGKIHGGRIDTLGIDENDCPVIVEYKRSTGENVINQGLFYLDWLLDHQAEFKLLTLEQLGQETADAIDWDSPRVLCIASDFTRYDAHAVHRIGASVELLRYRRFGSDLLLFELVNAIESGTGKSPAKSKPAAAPNRAVDPKPRPRWLVKIPPDISTIVQSLSDYIESLGDDVQRKNLKHYIAFKRLRNFATVVADQKSVALYLHLDPSKISLEAGFSRDMRKCGHWGTGNLEVVLRSLSDFEKAKPLISQSYDPNLIDVQPA